MALENLSRLKKLGLHIHIDDFGTGYSSLSRLHEFPLDVLKIDRTFVNTIEQHGRAIIEGAVLIAHQFNLHVIAEGVETYAQARLLHELGVDALQGYVLARPEYIPRMTPFEPVWIANPSVQATGLNLQSIHNK